MSEKFITIRLPQNLRNSWTYPNLLHFEKYVDLLLLSASEKRESYNKTYVYIKPGNVLLKYSFFSFRWKVSHKVCRSIFNVLSIAGWIKIKNVDCRSISNRKINVPLITFPKTGYDNGMVCVNVIGGNKVGTVVSNSNTIIYNDEGQTLGSGRDTDKDTDKENIKEGIKSSGRDSSMEISNDDIDKELTNEELDYYEEMLLDEANSKDSGKDSGKEPLIYNNGVGGVVIINKKENKIKEKRILPPTLDELRQFAVENNLDDLDVDYNYQYYSSAGWTDKDGNPIVNWKQFFLRINQKYKYRKKTQSETKKETTTDKLARQAFGLASHFAGMINENDKQQKNK